MLWILVSILAGDARGSIEARFTNRELVRPMSLILRGK